MAGTPLRSCKNFGWKHNYLTQTYVTLSQSGANADEKAARKISMNNLDIFRVQASDYSRDTFA